MRRHYGGGNTPASAGMSASFVAVAALLFVADSNQIGLDHFLHQRIERGLVMPAELGARLAGIAKQRIDLGWPEIAPIDFDQNAAIGGIDALLIRAAAAPDDAAADMGESLLDEFTHGVRSEEHTSELQSRPHL